MERTHNSLRRGWTTGSCATAAARAAWGGLCGGEFPDPVIITLPGGQDVAFALAGHGYTGEGAWAEVVKDAGDDPDVTHGAHVRVDVRHGPPGCGVVFHAGSGVGTVTLPGLPIPPGQPAINPVPRHMIRTALSDAGGHEPDVEVIISIAGGQELARRTLNARLALWGAVYSGHHGHRGAVFLCGVDRQHPSWRGRGTRTGPAPCGGLHRRCIGTRDKSTV